MKILSILFLLFWAWNLSAQRLATVVGTDVRIRNRATVEDSKIIAKVQPGDLLRVLDETVSYELLPNSNAQSDCWYFKWYQVELQDGTQGWTFGQNLYLIEPYKDFQSKPMKFNGKTYRLNIARNPSKGSEKGTLACFDPHMFVLVSDDNRKAALIEAKGAEYKGLCQQHNLFDNRGYWYLANESSYLHGQDVEPLLANTYELRMYSDYRDNQNDVDNRFFMLHILHLSMDSKGKAKVAVHRFDCKE